MWIPSEPCCVLTVAFFLIDGQKLLDHKGEEERYLKLVLNNFSQGLRRLKDDLLSDGQPVVEFPRIWTLALSKAALFPDWDVHSFRDLTDTVAGGADAIAEALIGEAGLNVQKLVRVLPGCRTNRRQVRGSGRGEDRRDGWRPAQEDQRSSA